MHMRTILLSSAIVAAAGGALVGQQQAAEAPASTRPGLTRPSVAGRHGLVSTGHPIASSAGLQILLKGGNAFDAAAAVGAMAALGEPEMNGIGGNGFMTVFHKATGKVWSLSMAGAAPPCPDIRTEVVAKKTMRLNPRSNAEILVVLMLAALSSLPDSGGIES